MNDSEQYFVALIKIPSKALIEAGTVFDKYVDKLINYINMMIYSYYVIQFLLECPV